MDFSDKNKEKDKGKRAPVTDEEKENAKAAKEQQSQASQAGRKAAAQRLWPSTKITHANADALLIAEFCRQIRNGR